MTENVLFRDENILFTLFDVYFYSAALWVSHCKQYCLNTSLVAHKNIGDDTFCNLWHNARRGWDHAALFNEELPLLDSVIRAKSKIEKRIEIDEEILILLGGEGILLERILSQHGIFDCITPDTSIPASMVADWIAMNAIADSGNERAKDAVNHQKGSHISEETFYAAYRAYFYRNRFSSLNIL